jgi:hypothetical protein
MNLQLASFILALLFFLGCVSDSSDQAIAGPNSKEFSNYWYQGEAEITSYKLEQARYGEIHQGHAVLIFVTEDFSRSKQVKLDQPESAGEDRVKVLKLNLNKKFNTGIYPYSMMSSIFTPVQWGPDGASLKITTSSQEWCGHTFTQFNKIESGYDVSLSSYFESEGDQNLSLPRGIPEDELWNAIRLNPDNLPTGKTDLIPGTMYQRLRHRELKVHQAKINLESDEQLMHYTVTYPDLNRTLTIHFRKDFPYEIEGWEETYRSGFGTGAAQLTTRAEKMERIMLDYWNKNGTDDTEWRKELGLEE